jgi:hypothetical protein
MTQEDKDLLLKDFCSRLRDFGRGVEVFYDNSCSLAMGYNMFYECFTEL